MARTNRTEFGSRARQLARKRGQDRSIGVMDSGVFGYAKITKAEFNPKLPGRNDPCLCGSGAKSKRCCSGR